MLRSTRSWITRSIAVFAALPMGAITAMLACSDLSTAPTAREMATFSAIAPETPPAALAGVRDAIDRIVPSLAGPVAPIRASFEQLAMQLAAKRDAIALGDALAAAHAAVEAYARAVGDDEGAAVADVDALRLALAAVGAERR